MYTHNENFKYKVMPFRWVNVLATFQQTMSTILQPLLNKGVVVYHKDILIYTKTTSEHRELVTKVFSRLQNEGQAVIAHKSFFHIKEVEFLEYIINVNGVEMSNRKVKVVRSWKTPKNLKDIQCFLGFEIFYRRFRKNFSDMAGPNTDLTQNKGLVFYWGPLQVVTFQQLKDAFTSTPLLKHFGPSREVIIETDVSNFAIGCILS
jgi:hypothetical protein